MQYTSAEYRATVTDGLLVVHRLQPVELVETTFDGGKVTQRTVGPDAADSIGKLAAEMSRWPVFAATADEDDRGWFYCDIDAGFQRWIGSKPRADVREALVNCGFEPGDIKAMLKACTDEPWSYCPRQVA
jgi:hypothetical protein